MDNYSHIKLSELGAADLVRSKLSDKSISTHEIVSKINQLDPALMKLSFLGFSIFAADKIAKFINTGVRPESPKSRPKSPPSRGPSNWYDRPKSPKRPSPSKKKSASSVYDKSDSLVGGKARRTTKKAR